MCYQDVFVGYDIGGGVQCIFFFGGFILDVYDSVGYNVVYFGVDFFFVLEEVGYVLYLFKVVDGYFVGVVDNVWYYDYVVFGQYVVCFWIGWVVGFFQYQFVGQFFCVFVGDLFFQCCWDQDVYWGGLEGVFIDFLGVWEIGNLFFFCLSGGEGGYIDFVFVIQGCGMILNNYDMSVDVSEQVGCFVIDVIKVLQCYFGVFNFDIGVMGNFLVGDKYVVFGGFFMIEGVVEVDWFVGDYVGDGGVMVYGVSVYYLCYYFVIGVDVWCWNIFLWFDNNVDFVGVMVGQMFQFIF